VPPSAARLIAAAIANCKHAISPANLVPPSGTKRRAPASAFGPPRSRYRQLRARAAKSCARGPRPPRPFSARPLDRWRRGFEELVAKVVGFVEAPSLGLDLSLDARGTASNASGNVAGDSRGFHCELRGRREADRGAEVGSRGGKRLQRERHRGGNPLQRERHHGGNPLPPCRAKRRCALGLPLVARKRALLERETSR
jgi:hypothetical protein